MIVPVIGIGSLPPPGQPASAINDVEAGALFTKRNGYNCVEFCVPLGMGSSGTYAIYRYWDDDQTWRQEGPRGATPVTFDSGANAIPVRISVPIVERQLCVVAVTGEDSENAIIEEQNR